MLILLQAGTKGPRPEGELRTCINDLHLRFGTKSYANAYFQHFIQRISFSVLKKGTLNVSLYVAGVSQRINHKEWNFEHKWIC